METESGVTLTQMAYYGRKGVKITVFLLVALIVGRTFWNAASSYWIATHPPAPPPPTQGFNRLPPLNFPAKTSAEKPTSYQLQTADGGFPDFGDRAKVFLMPRSTPSLLADQQAKQIASQFGFVFAPTPLDSRTYRWNRSQTLQSTLEMDIQNHTFTLTTNYLSIPTLFSNASLPADNQAASIVKNFISQGIPLGEDIATSSGTISYLKAAGSQVIPAVSFSDADFLQVDLMREPIDSVFEMYTPAGKKGIIQAILAGGSDQGNQIVHLEDKYRPVSYDQVETYPIRSPQSAWQILQAGEGYVAQKGNSDTAVVRTVVLGYYDDFSEQDYLQPIYVFQGDGGFLGFVPAVAPQDIQQVGQTTQTPTK